MADKDKPKQPDRPAPRRKTPILVLVEHADHELDTVLSTLSTFGEATVYTPPAAAAIAATTQAPQRDAYGNLYDRSVTVDVSRDQYGNPYNTSGEPAAPEPRNGRDAYGNPY